MTEDTSLPQLTGQWITLVPLKGPVQLPSRPKQMIDSYATIWQTEGQLKAGDGFGSVNEGGVVTMYGDTAQYDCTSDEIIWLGDQGLNALVRTVDLAGVWVDGSKQVHELAQKESPVRLTITETVLGVGLRGTITGQKIRLKDLNNDGEKCGTLSVDCSTINWADGSVWKRHLHIQGGWVSIINKLHVAIERQNEKEVLVGGVPGTLDLSDWYIHATNQPFPDNKVKGGIDFDSTMIHWADYIGWQRVFALEGVWIDTSNEAHEITKQRIKDPKEYRRFIWLFDTSCGGQGTQIRNWIEIDKRGSKVCGQVTYDSSKIYFDDGDVWTKQA